MGGDFEAGLGAAARVRVAADGVGAFPHAYESEAVAYANSAEAVIGTATESV
ncbi:hypothetical protein ACWGH2_03555 [Streptomyces sp. NPDC054871]